MPACAAATLLYAFCIIKPGASALSMTGIAAILVPAKAEIPLIHDLK
jgi:hypothetical protein